MSATSRHQRCFLAVIAAFFCIAATTLNDSDLKFRITIPDGFEPSKENMRDKDDLYFFIRPAPDPTQARAAIKISSLRGMLPIDPPMKGFTSSGVQLEITPVTWKAHTLRRVRGIVDVGGQQVVSLNVQIPLKPEAISITVAGAADNEPELAAVLRDVLASVEGETNWVSDKNEVKKRISRDLYSCLIFVAIIAIVIYIRRQSRRDESSG